VHPDQHGNGPDSPRRPRQDPDARALFLRLSGLRGGLPGLQVSRGAREHGRRGRRAGEGPGRKDDSGRHAERVRTRPGASARGLREERRPDRLLDRLLLRGRGGHCLLQVPKRPPGYRRGRGRGAHGGRAYRGNRRYRHKSRRHQARLRQGCHHGLREDVLPRRGEGPEGHRRPDHHAHPGGDDGPGAGRPPRGGRREPGAGHDRPHGRQHRRRLPHGDARARRQRGLRPLRRPGHRRRPDGRGAQSHPAGTPRDGVWWAHHALPRHHQRLARPPARHARRGGGSPEGLAYNPPLRQHRPVPEGRGRGRRAARFDLHREPAAALRPLAGPHDGGPGDGRDGRLL
ncbi:MAG: phosphotriesterase, putative, partial [uncultured Rubrobacteraceae bacterium]